jgi:hypothetical protein
VTDSPIVTRLKSQEAVMLELLSEYAVTLDRVADIVHGLKVDVEWGKIIRFSTTSNFALITGVGTIHKGQAIGDTILEEDHNIPVSMTLLLEMLDDESTPYQIADVAQAIANVRKVLGPEEFHMFLKDETSDIEKIEALLPNLDTLEECEASHELIKSGETPSPNIKKSDPELHGKLSGFNTGDLTDAQHTALKLNYMAHYKR